MKRFLVLLQLIIIATSYSFSQVPVGELFDINGFSFDGYYDPIAYNPINRIRITHNYGSFEKGHYYDKNDIKNCGFIKYENKKIWFKKDINRDSSQIKLKAEEVNSLVIGIDSFFTISNFDLGTKHIQKKEFVQFITQFDSLTFIKHYRFRSSMSATYGNIAPIVETYLVKTKDSNNWNYFSKNDEIFKKQALKYFGHIDYIKNGISSGRYSTKDILKLIKMTDYQHKYQNNLRIYFDQYWQELNAKHNAYYTANILNVKDSIWTLKYLRNDTILFVGKFSSFYPVTKNGLFTFYFEFGEIREEILFAKNKIRNVKRFDKNGDTLYEYDHIKESDGWNGYIRKRKYKFINNQNKRLENEILKGIELNIFDSINNRLYKRHFSDMQLKNSYSIISGNQVYQYCDPDFDFKVKSLQKKTEYYFSERNYYEALSNNAQGIILVWFVINPKGYIIDYKFLNSIHPEIEGLLNNFITNILLGKVQKKHKFPPYTLNKQKCYSEVVIPVDFGINRFYRPPVNSVYDNLYWHHWHMMNPPQPHVPNLPPPRY